MEAEDLLDPAGEPLQAITEEFGRAAAQSIISQKESLRRVLLRGESWHRSTETPGIRRILQPPTLVPILMDGDDNTVKQNVVFFPATALSGETQNLHHSNLGFRCLKLKLPISRFDHNQLTDTVGCNLLMQLSVFCCFF